MSDLRMRKKFSGLHAKPCFQNSQCSSKPVAVICIYFTRILVSNFQNHSLFNPFSDSCLSKIRVKTWIEEPYIGDLHAIPTKFTNKLLSFHYRKIAIAQNNERETYLIQRACILTWFSLWSIHNKWANSLARSLSFNYWWNFWCT